MAEPQQYQIVIVGGGPAGLSTALHLAQLSPELAAQTVILEANAHPRPKLCGGGVTIHAEKQLTHLGIQIDVPAVHINRIAFHLGTRRFEVLRQNAMRIIQREEFDAALAHAVAARKLRLHSSERLLDLTRTEDGVLLHTNKGSYWARVVVGADGANSTVRQRMKLPHTDGIARLLRVMTPITMHTASVWERKTAVFDFSCVRSGIQGYIWHFPCYVSGQAYMNRGIFDSRIVPQPARQRPSLKQAFTTDLFAQQVNLQNIPVQGHPVRWFNPEAAFSQPHLLLAGDAAGVDPLFAEGISYAMEYGDLVAAELKQAFATNDFSFSKYRQHLVQHSMGKMLQRRMMFARQLYLYERPWFWALFWQLATIAPPRLQRLFAAMLGLLPP